MHPHHCRPRPRPRRRLRIAAPCAHGLRHAVCRHRDHYTKLAGLWASAWLLYLYALSSTTSSPPPSSLLRLLHLLRQPRAASAYSLSSFCTATVVETSSTGPLHSATWLCALPCTSGIGNTGAFLRPQRATGSGKLGTRLGLGGLTASSSLRPQRITIFIFLRRLRTTTIWLLLAGQWLHVRLPRQLRQPRLPYARHPRPWLFTLVSATSTSAQRAIIHMRLRQFCSNHSIHTALRLCLWGDVNPLLPIFGFFSSLVICSAPTVTVGEY